MPPAHGREIPPVKPKIVRTVAALRRETAKWRADGFTCALVPTMGALHEGHLELVREGGKRADRVITTIFVNPKQFAAHEDLSRYPRDEAGDVQKLVSAGTHLVYAPAPEEIYPENFATTVSLAGPAKAGLEDKFRPDFLVGVTTVVAKLFIQTGADFAVFGEKDYQQLKTVVRMAKDLDIPIKVVGVPTVREPDGLAMSSRNAYLSEAERKLAPAIFRSLSEAASSIRKGLSPENAARAARDALAAQGFKVDYVAARDAETLAFAASGSETLRLLAAVWLGDTRLIDNVAG